MRLAIPGVLLSAAFCVVGCGGFASESQLLMKASAEFDCEKDNLTVRDTGNGVREVNGCGRSQRYVYREEASSWLHEDDAGGKVIEVKPLP